MDFSSEAKMYGNFGEEKKSWVRKIFGGAEGDDPYEGAGRKRGNKAKRYEDAFDHDFSGAGKFTDAVADKFHMSPDKAKILVSIIVIIIVMCVFSSTVRDIVLYIPRKLLSLVKEGFTMIETPNGILSEDLTVDQNGYLS